MKRGRKPAESVARSDAAPMRRPGRWEHWAGVMSGTSLDGVDAVLARFRGRPPEIEWELLAHVPAPFETVLRRRLFAMAEGEAIPVREVARAHVALGELYAAAVLELLRTAGLGIEKLSGVTISGQTVHHQSPRRARGEGVSLQLGSGPVVAERLGAPVVSDLRAADMAAGGEGAPLVPYADWLLFRSVGEGRVILNVGGIANLTAFPAGAVADNVVAFDTGPGNLVMDGLVRALSGGQEAFDEGGRRAARGRPDLSLLEEALRHPFFATSPPRSTGREEFGEVFVRDWLARGREVNLSEEDLVATACALTAESVASAIREFVKPRFAVQALYAAGGGARNQALLQALARRLGSIRIETSEALGVPVECREALAFATLGRETLARRPGNLPSVTGASRRTILGSVSDGRRP